MLHEQYKSISVSEVDMTDTTRHAQQHQQALDVVNAPTARNFVYTALVVVQMSSYNEQVLKHGKAK